MKIFGAIISLAQNEERNYLFLNQLLNHSAFDAFHLFFSGITHAQFAADKLISDKTIPEPAKDKIEIYILDTLKEKLCKITYDRFFLSDAKHFETMNKLRRKYASQNFPLILLNRMGYNSSLDNKMTKQEAKNIMNFAQDTKYILYLGRISHSTKADLYPLLSVFKSLTRRCGFKIKLLLAGAVNPKELPIHKDMIIELGLSETVQLLINFDEAKKKALISSAELCVFPADNTIKTLGTALVEAAACGVAPIVSDIYYYRNLVIQNETGFKIKTVMPDDFAPCEIQDLYDFPVLQTMLAQATAVDCSELEEKIYLLLNDDELRKKIGESAAKNAAENYRWNIVIKEYESAEKDNFPKEENENFLQNHSDFATLIFNENMFLELTENGKEIVNRTKQIPPAHSDCSTMLDADYLRKILKYLSQKNCSGVQEIFTKFPDENTKGRFTLLWAAKYGIIRFKEQQ